MHWVTDTDLRETPANGMQVVIIQRALIVKRLRPAVKVNQHIAVRVHGRDGGHTCEPNERQ